MLSMKDFIFHSFVGLIWIPLFSFPYALVRRLKLKKMVIAAFFLYLFWEISYFIKWK